MLSFNTKVNNKTFTIAHRGASAHEHENTLRAFQKAIEMDADAIELDIHKTKDNVLVVHHDPFLKDQKQLIANINYHEIQQFNISSVYQIPTLEEILILCKNKIAIDIELKEFGYENKVVELALKYYKRENLLFTSFDKNSLDAIYSIDNNLCTGYLFHKPVLLKSIPSFVDYLLPFHALCKIGYLNKLKSLGKPIIIWTVDKQKTKEKYREKNIFALITNDPVKTE